MLLRSRGFCSGLVLSDGERGSGGFLWNPQQPIGETDPGVCYLTKRAQELEQSSTPTCPQGTALNWICVASLSTFSLSLSQCLPLSFLSFLFFGCSFTLPFALCTSHSRYVSLSLVPLSFHHPGAVCVKWGSVLLLQGDMGMPGAPGTTGPVVRNTSSQQKDVCILFLRYLVRHLPQLLSVLLYNSSSLFWCTQVMFQCSQLTFR